ncbi:PREDICTED: B3 domain-containing transcription factor VRN1-like [Nicotiana attenuata]|uniref:B3 domain-containing transcription factor VRN1-like n=1 Tax=Nicotiana attenuata TaxID=49451 RepID=UPI000904EAB2|nr:PREDICTED: B3 domain-containing transcription factor VRN1-like [Nicotiana attenuata]
MPVAFVKENKKMLAKQCLLKTDEAGTLWEAKIVREERSSKYNICEGEWPQFVEYHKLELGDILFFYLIDKSMFHVQPYTKKCCRNLPPFDELSSSEEEEHATKVKTKQNESSEPVQLPVNIYRKRSDMGIMASSAVSYEAPIDIWIFGMKRVCLQQIKAHRTCTAESDHSLEILAKIPDMVEHSVGHGPVGQSNKRKRQGNAEEAALDSFTRKGQSCNTMFEQQSKTVYDVKKTVMPKLIYKEWAIAYQRAKAFKSKNPFFISLMQPTYTSGILYVRLTFARKYFGENCSNLVLRVPGRGSWPVKCSLGQVQAKIKGGWREFVLDNKLKLGDACVFEVIEGNPLFIDVTIFRAAGSTPMRETD